MIKIPGRRNRGQLEREHTMKMRESGDAENRIWCDYNIAILSITGDFSLGEVPGLLEKLTRTQGFRRSMNSIVDLRTARLSADTGEINRLADIFLAHQVERGHSFRTAVICSDDFTFGICRMVAVELEAVPIWMKVVRTMEEGLVWVQEPELPGFGFAIELC